MKRTFIWIALFSINIMLSQTEFIPKRSLSFSLKHQVAFGNNYLNNDFENARGFGISYQINYKKNIFLGVLANLYKANVVNKESFGDFYSSSSFLIGTFIGYRQQLVNEKYFLEHQFGLGIKTITNKSNLGDYTINGVPIFIGSKLNYKLNQKTTLFGGLDFNYFKNGVEISGPYKNYYTLGYFIETSIGIKYNFKK